MKKLRFKKVLVLITVLTMIITVASFSALAVGVTVGFDENPTFSITADNIQPYYYSGNVGFGDFHALYFDAGAQITFNAPAELFNMGEPALTVAAGDTVNISEIDGFFAYLGLPFASTYIVFVGPMSALMYAPPNIPLVESIPADFAAFEAPAAPPPAEVTAPPTGGGVIALPEDMRSYWFPGTDIKVGLSGVYDYYFDFDLAAAGFGTGNVFALFFDDDGEIAFSQGTTLTTFDADFNAITRIVNAGDRIPVAEVNGWNFALGGSGNSLAFILTSAPGNFAGMPPTIPLVDLALTEAPPPLEFTVRLREQSNIDLRLFDVHETYGHLFEDLATRTQRIYLFRLKAEGYATWSSDIILHFANAQTGAIEDNRTIHVSAGEQVPAHILHGARWYLGNDFNSNYAMFVDDTNPSLVSMPLRFINPADMAASMTTLRATAILELHDGMLRPYGLFSGDSGRQTLLVVIGCLAVSLPLGIAILVSHKKELNSGGVKFDHAEINTD